MYVIFKWYLKEPLARNRRDIWSLSDSSKIRTYNHLLRLNGWVYVYKPRGCGFESRCCHYDKKNVEELAHPQRTAHVLFLVKKRIPQLLCWCDTMNITFCGLTYVIISFRFNWEFLWWYILGNKREQKQNTENPFLFLLSFRLISSRHNC